ncbi:MAG: M1 family metallopeptidase, partial [Chloroflexi bacterium]|nr:M1 family metallopeptidase [Chloroflexota bacterium]
MTTTPSTRLPGNVHPLHYRLSLEPDLDLFTFAGHEEIEVAVETPTTWVTLNASELDVSRASVETAAGTSVAEAIEYDEEQERVTLRFPSPLPAGQAVLSLDFTGVLNDQLRGFYRSTYLDNDGVERRLATTQFEATDARRAFPCWDEPSVKASFDVTLVVPEELEAISNMAIASTEPVAEGRKAVTFDPTPAMSTYLLAFVVGDMACVQGNAEDGTLVRVWATRGKEELGRFALENSIAALRYMNDYFGIPYPLAKMDHIAVPDFAAGAMENWGAITYRETALLYDPQNSAPQAKQRILEVVAHEMAHMWFGDLVTMEWWDDLWLNESFASWMGDKTVDHLYPEWEMWTQFVSHDTNAALGLDGLRNSHPIEANVDDPAEIRELFDAISYSKGGSVLRMLEDYVGPETFRKGLHTYLSGHAYGNARGEHLWAAINTAADEEGLGLGVPVVPLMEAWIKQTGYPVLTTEIARSVEKAEAAVTQSRFLYDRLLGEAADPALWPIPVSIAHGGNGAPSKHVLAGERALLAAGAGDQWVKLNAGQTGFFRVAYTEGEWRRLGEAISSGALPPVDRLGLQNDAYALVKSGHLPATVFLELAESFVGETDAIVWGDLAANLRGLEGLLSSTPHLDAFRVYARSLFARIAAQVGWDAQSGDGHLESLRRSIVINQFGGYGDERTLAEALARFRKHASGEETLVPDMRAAAFGLASQQSGRDVADALWNLHDAADLHEEKVRILGALTRTRDSGLLADLLDRSLSDRVRSQDTPIVLIQAGASPDGREQTWRVVRGKRGGLGRGP